jgi:hypothetical protein
MRGREPSMLEWVEVEVEEVGLVLTVGYCSIEVAGQGRVRDCLLKSSGCRKDAG